MIACQAIIYIALSKEADSDLILTACMCVCDCASAYKKHSEVEKRLLLVMYRVVLYVSIYIYLSFCL